VARFNRQGTLIQIHRRFLVVQRVFDITQGSQRIRSLPDGQALFQGRLGIVESTGMIESQSKLIERLSQLFLVQNGIQFSLPITHFAYPRRLPRQFDEGELDEFCEFSRILVSPEYPALS
jgi:hypothetical protein